MLLLISPAKTLDFETPAPLPATANPVFAPRAGELVELLRQRSAAEIGELMELSQPLAELNVERYRAWSPRFPATTTKPALYAFNGDVYEGLDAASLGAADVAWAQEHLAILSALYGVLRPLDRLQAYRLEMGTRLANPRGKDLYAFWGDAIAEHLNERLAGEKSPLVVNLASQEYFRAADRKALRARVVECVFEDWKGGGYKVISFFAKRARGMMARHAIRKRAATTRALESFNQDGYAFDRGASEPDRLVFRRRQA
jgi:hypothetical protein